MQKKDHFRYSQSVYPTFKVGPDERPSRVNEYGFDSASSNGFWVVPN